MSAESAVQVSRPRGPLVEARDVVRSFGQMPALRGANLSAASGEIVAVMGPSGSPAGAATVTVTTADGTSNTGALIVGSG
jgi:ABC-type transporter Mla maintaining outer membrane lipid asymmetry ATPase subunit MlaF